MAGPAKRFRDEWLIGVLKGQAAVAPERLERWRAEDTPFLSQRMMDEGLLTFEQLARLIWDVFRIDATDLKAGVAADVARLLPETLTRKHFVMPVRAEQRQVDLAMANPLDEDALKDVSVVTGRRVNPLFCAPAALERATLEDQAPDAVIYNLLRKFEADTPVEVVEREGEQPLQEGSERMRSPVIQLANNVIATAVRHNASDIHIEHDETNTTVRYRVDGLLRNVLVLPRYVGAGPLVSRIKIMAGLDISDRMRPQDGRAKLKVGADTVGLRVSTLPARTGEKVVLRILNERAVQARLATLGFHPDVLERFTAMLAREQGIVLVTGPTGSGKTTTLYAALHQVHGETVNVVTVEDPIEYRLADITQVQVNEKQDLTFAAVLRSVLRQDPDIVMVGEIRDAETAAIATQAALTGHLVLSTLHTNDSVGAITRLADLGVEPFKIANALAGVTAQRLVRRLCPACAEPAPVADLPAAVREAMQRLFGRAAHRVAKGCEQCGYAGYKGRLPVVELLDVGLALKEAVGRGAGDAELRRKAAASGALHGMETDALWHVVEGHTTLEQVQPFLELERLAASAAPADAAAPAPDARRARVLVAVASPLWKAVLDGALAACDCDVAWVDNGVDALASVAQRQPDLLVLTPDLPGLPAEQVVRGVRTVVQALDVGTIAILAEEDPADRARLAAAGVDEVMAPPVDGAALQARIAAVLARRHAWRSAQQVARPPVPLAEAQRLAALRDTGLLDTPPEERFDAITREAAERFRVPIALISLVDTDRQWFKSRQGVVADQTARDISFCGHAINYDDVFVVEDAALDARFWDNPLVTGEPGIRFYAGAQIHGPGGRHIGMLCINDHVPRLLTDAEKETLRALACRVEAEIARQPQPR